MNNASRQALFAYIVPFLLGILVWIIALPKMLSGFRDRIQREVEMEELSAKLKWERHLKRKEKYDREHANEGEK